MNVSTAMETTLNMARRPIRRRYVPNTGKATGTAEGASTSSGKAETEETADAERAIRDLWLNYQTEE
jgi:hypothetical protein